MGQASAFFIGKTVGPWWYMYCGTVKTCETPSERKETTYSGLRHFGVWTCKVLSHVGWSRKKGANHGPAISMGLPLSLSDEMLKIRRSTSIFATRHKFLREILLMLEILHQLIGSLSVYPIISKVLYIPGGLKWDFWTINSISYLHISEMPRNDQPQLHTPSILLARTVQHLHWFHQLISHAQSYRDFQDHGRSIWTDSKKWSVDFLKMTEEIEKNIKTHDFLHCFFRDFSCSIPGYLLYIVFFSHIYIYILHHHCFQKNKKLTDERQSLSSFRMFSYIFDLSSLRLMVNTNYVLKDLWWCWHGVWQAWWVRAGN